MEDIRGAVALVEGGYWRRSLPLIQRYADQHAEQAKDEAQLVIDDLTAQLERALVPRFKVGDRVTLKHEPKNDRIREVGSPVIFYEVPGYGRASEESLSPLPEKCQHNDIHGNSYASTIYAGLDYNNCPRCGASLTSGGD
jgi:hypothetical protein